MGRAEGAYKMREAHTFLKAFFCKMLCVCDAFYLPPLRGTLFRKEGLTCVAYGDDFCFMPQTPAGLPTFEAGR